MVVGELPGLRSDRLGHLLPAVTDVDAIEAGKAVEQTVAFTIVDEDTFAAGDDAVFQLAAGELGKVSRRMKEVIVIPLVELIVAQHCLFLFCCVMPSRGRHT